MLGIVTLRKRVRVPSEGTVAYTLAAIKDWTFLLGPGWVVGWGNGLILGYLMYSSGLVPRHQRWLGLIGGPLIIVPGRSGCSAATIAEPRAALAASDRDHPGVSVGAVTSASTARSGVPARCPDPWRDAPNDRLNCRPTFRIPQMPRPARSGQPSDAVVGAPRHAALSLAQPRLLLIVLSGFVSPGGW